MPASFGAGGVSVEAPLLDFDGDLYEQPITPECLQWLRAQRRFESAQALVDQIRRDVACTREISHTHRMVGIIIR